MQIRVSHFYCLMEKALKFPNLVETEISVNDPLLEAEKKPKLCNPRFQPPPRPLLRLNERGGGGETNF